ncbi:hypothetical protein DYB32_001882 [Aphanomyces invadans]|uniref:B30.2/SPRY domain-containing protein n=1 Tax=Aphanomyces invadans TaxID=157072 RepID=A0A3R6Z9Y5_9STRA|nr:hypothetical protein DYB32_001882 [Aphanomyces invadans]
MREWKQDRRWGGMGRHLVEDIHVSFRRGFEILVKKGEARREVNVSSFRHLDNNLHHHHSIEDQMWFPRLKQLHPECQSEVEVLERDHRKLIELESQVTSGDYAALVEFVDHLMDHLNREEMLSVPWLLDGTGGETSEVPCTDEVEPEAQPEKDLCHDKTADGEEHVYPEGSKPAVALPCLPQEDVPILAPAGIPTAQRHDHNTITSILRALQDECDRSYQQVHSLATRLRGMPEDMQLFLEGHLNALENQRRRLVVQATALQQIPVDDATVADTTTLLESKPAKRGCGPPPKHLDLASYQQKRHKIRAGGDHKNIKPPAASSSPPPLRWDPSRVGIHATVSSRGCRLKTIRSAWNVAMGNVKVSSFCVKVELNKSKARNAIAIGFIKEPKFWEVPNGDESVFVFNYSGWYLNVRKGTLCSLQGHDDAPFGTPFKSGDILMTILDHTSKTVSFVHNGSHLGIAYSNVDDDVLFPAVISYDAKIELTFLE